MCWLINCCTAFKYLGSSCYSSCSTLQKPSTFPSSTCIDLLWSYSCMLYRGYYSIYVICIYSAKTKSFNIVMYVTMPIPPRVVMIELYLFVCRKFPLVIIVMVWWGNRSCISLRFSRPQEKRSTVTTSPVMKMSSIWLWSPVLKLTHS